MKKILSLLCLLPFAFALHANTLHGSYVAVNGNTASSIPARASLTTAPYVVLPVITVANSVTTVAFTGCAGNTLSTASFTVSGSQLMGNLVVTADAGFGVSTSTGGSFTSSLSLMPSSGTVSSTVIYVRANAGSSSGATGNIVCSSTLATSRTIAGTVTVYALPVFLANPASEAQSYCQSATATALSVNFAPGSGNQASYRWYANSVSSNTGGTGIGVGATSISGASALTQTYVPPTTTAGTTYYYAVATNSYGCSAASTVSGAITINAKPTVVTLTSLNSSNGINICTGTKANLTADSVTAGSTTGLVFSYAKDYLFTNAVADPASVNSGSYYIKGTDSQTCSSSPTLIRVIQKSNPAISSAVVVDNECDFETKGSITLNLSATGTPPFSYAWTKSGDNSFSSTSQNLTGLAIGTYNLSMVDAYGCTAQFTTPVSAQDYTNPVEPVLPDIQGECSVTVTAPTTTDNCSGIVTGMQENYPYDNEQKTTITFTGQGTYYIDWIFVDDWGNTSFATQKVIVADVTPPVAPVVADLSGECSVTATAPTAEDNCAGTITGTTADPLTYSAPGTYTINWVFDDGNGNLSYTTQNVTVTDTIAPVTPVLEDVVVECGADYTTAAPTAEDACSGIIAGTTTDPLVYTRQGTYLVNWAFDDGHGNVSYATQKIIVKDTTAPVVPVLTAVTEQCNATVTAPTTTDNCAGAITGTTTDPLSYTEQGNYTITWTFADGNGNSVTATQQVVIRDTIQPVAPVLADITAECSATVTAPTTTDNCAGTITGTTTDPLSYTEQGTYTITWTFADGNGNSVTATQQVIIKDSTAPIVPVLADVTGQCAATVTAPTTTDNCAGTISGTTTDPLSYTEQGTFTITWTFADGNGNSSTATQTVVIRDTTKPTITAPSAVSVNTDTALCSATVSAETLGTPVTADNCGVATVTNDAPATFPVGTTTVTWTVTDINGNTQTATQTVTVTDREKPTITAPEAVSVNTDAGQCSATLSAELLGTPVTADNCGVDSVTNDAPATFPVGTTTVTWTVTDIHGNTQTTEQTVTVTDNENPTITAPADITAANYNGACDGTGVSLGTPVTADNCGVATVTNNAPATFPAGTTTVTWTVTDIHGNTATVTQTVTRPAPLTASAVATHALCAGGNGSVALTVSGGTTAYRYRWSNGDTTQNLQAVTAGTYTVTVTDAKGCTATASATVTQPARITVGASGPANVCTGSAASFSATGGVSYSWSGPNGFTSTSQNPTIATMASANTGTYTVVVTDANGCSNTATVLVSVKSCSGIYPTEVNCSDFNTGTANKLASVCITTKTSGGKTTVSNATPGVFFYYTNIVAPAASFSVYVSQTASSALGTNFSLSQGYAFAFANGCTKIATGAAAAANGDALINIKGVKAGTLITIAVKYDAKSIQGRTVNGSLPSVSSFVCRLGTTAASPVIENTATTISIANCSGTIIAAPTVTTTANSSAATAEVEATAEIPAVQVKAYPNPFVGRVNFTLRSAVSGSALLEVYDISGRKVGVPFTGTLQAGTAHTLSYTVPAGINGVLIYRFRVGSKTVEGKLIALK